MADPLIGFRTITECHIARYHYVGSPPVLVPVPVSVPINPSSFQLNPGLDQADIMQTSCTGEDQIVLRYNTKSIPELDIGFELASPELDGFIVNRLAQTDTNYAGWVYFSVEPTEVNVTGKTPGNYGNSVVAQVANTTEARVYYNDPITKLAKIVTVVDSTPTGDQMMIGNNLELTLSQELVNQGYQLYGWVPCEFANVTLLSAESIPMVGVWAVGIYFDESVRLFSARKCSIMTGGSFTKEPKRDIKLRVLADASAKTGYGWDWVTLREKIDC